MPAAAIVLQEDYIFPDIVNMYDYINYTLRSIILVSVIFYLIEIFERLYMIRESVYDEEVRPEIALPGMILALSYYLLFIFLEHINRLNIPEVDITISGISHSLKYEYSNVPTEKGNYYSFMSYDFEDTEIKIGDFRKLHTSNWVIVPEGHKVRFILRSFEGSRTWSIPSLDIKLEAMSHGKSEETIVVVPREGVYYGECTEICGTSPASRLVVVEAVSTSQFRFWLTRRLIEIERDE